MGYGHYNNFALNSHSQGWHLFDDQQVTKEQPQNIVTDSAYILFYKRKWLIHKYNVWLDYINSHLFSWSMSWLASWMRSSRALLLLTSSSISSTSNTSKSINMPKSWDYQWCGQCGQGPSQSSWFWDKAILQKYFFWCSHLRTFLHFYFKFV